MPWIDVSEPFAKPPKLPAIGSPSDWSGGLQIDEGWAELVGVQVVQDELNLTTCRSLSVVDSVVSGAAFVGGTEASVELRHSRFETCDFGQAHITSIRGARIEGCKLHGSDLSGAALTDVIFDRCVLRATNLRTATLRRVQFLDCVLEEVDCFEVTAEDVDVTGSRLSKVDVDRLQATRVDLRGATELTLNRLGRLSGCLVAEHQLPGLAYSLALAADLGIERPADQ